MKKYIFLLFSFFIIGSIFSQNVLEYDYSSQIYNYDLHTIDGIVLRNDIMILSRYYGFQNDDIEKYPIRWSIENKNKYITFYYNGKLLGDNITHGTKKYLVLAGGDYTDNVYFNDDYPSFIAFYDENNDLVAFFANKSYDFPSRSHIIASSELKEKGIIYRAVSLTDISYLTPWVEGVSGSGIGEKIKFLDTNCSNSVIVISNGFVDYKRPYLYEYNNRVKKMKVSYDGKFIGEEDNYIIINFEDTPDFQVFNIFPRGYGDLIFEIIDIYPGSRYDDTCINYLEIYNTGK
jgi:hypothetical protein